MNATNTKGAIAAANKNTADKPIEGQKPVQALNTLLSSKTVQNQLQSTLKESAGTFAASLLSLFKDDNLLQQCDPRAVFMESMKVAALKLPIEKQMGFAYIIAYKGKPQFQLGYKGMIQLCMRTGAYKIINADVVYEGEFISSNKLTGEVDLSGEKISDKIVGYFAYIETTNGFKKALYWSREKVIEHARKFSKNYNSTNSVWKTNFDSMAIKTVLRNLLSKYGVMSVEMVSAMQAESAAESIDDATEFEAEYEIETSVEITEETPVSEKAPPVPSAPDEYPFVE
ncbi:MAG: recombinase RecT [Oscillospiraceae bacterium]|nr:recombinase RecT [Oscillospiraceae bacterium]